MLATEPSLAQPVREAMASEVTFARLGAIFPDLPFYTNIVPMTLGYWLELAAENCPIAHRMHSDHPDRFAWRFLGLATADRTMTPLQRLALLGGFFSHVALDLELHPLVNWCARRDVIRFGGEESHHHRLAEKYHSLFFHVDHEGRDCLGRRDFFEDRSRVLDDPFFLRLQPDLPVIRWAAEVLSFYREDAPTPHHVAKWLRTFRHFTFLVSLPAAERNGRRLGHDAHRERYYDNGDFRFVDFWDRGYRRSVTLINQALEIFESGDLSEQQRRRFLAMAEISDLAYPPERGLPPLSDRVHDLELVPA
jgi:hypothetical protein